MNIQEIANAKKLQGERTRRRILMAGMAMFAEKGYKGATIRDIVGMINCTVNVVSLYYGSKAGLANKVVEELEKTIVKPVVHDEESIASDYAWRVAVKRFVRDVIGLFNAKEEPNCYFAALYRHESANLHAKEVTLHDRIIRPIFHRLEALMAMGVADRNRLTVRLWTLALWNNIIAYALKHPDVISQDVPEGMDPVLFRETTIDFMVDKCIRELQFTPSSAGTQEGGDSGR